MELLEGAAAHAAQCGAERLFLRVAEDSEADLVAQQAGFTPSFQEHLYIRSRRSAGNGAVDGVSLREAGPQDEHGLFQLYNAATPAEVRATRALTLSQWQDSREDSAGRVTELVWLDGDRLFASARYSRSSIGVHLEIVALPSVGGRMDGFLAILLRRVNARRMLRCLAPDYAPELGRALEAWGFQRSAGYRVWVRAIASPVLAPGLAPARALNRKESALATPAQRWIVDDLEALIEVLPQRVQVPLRAREELSSLLEVVLDLGRKPVARFLGRDIVLDRREITEEEILQLTSRIGAFGDDNRAGIERTLHRISAIRNRAGRIVGLTCRVGRAVYGTIRVIEDLAPTGKSILLLGRPGVGKTTMLREVARVLADEFDKRVIIVDTSNEIAGDGDIPHPAIGKARRMQVPTPSLQHAVMIEAVENHMPEVIIIDEMGTELEAMAARTIAERGVQLVATAHGNTLENLAMNPTLSDLVGGIQSVTLGDDEARRRGTRKSVLERKVPPTFHMLVEIQNWSRVAFHRDVARTVDLMLQGVPPRPEVRWIDEAGELRQSDTAGGEAEAVASVRTPPQPADGGTSPRIFSFGVSRDKLAQAARQAQVNMQAVEHLKDADLLLTTKNHYRKGAQALALAEELGKPVYVLRKNTALQLEQFLLTVSVASGGAAMHEALQEVEEAAGRLMEGEGAVELQPQGAYIRRLQHQLARNHNLASRSVGRDPYRRVTLSQTNGRD